MITKPTEEILFQTGFEGATRLTPAVGSYFHGSADQYEDFQGATPTDGPPSDWGQIESRPVLGSLRVYYEGGDETMRFARIVPDEADHNNHLLRFWIGQPNVIIHEADGPRPKSRVQTELYQNTGLKALYQSVRVRFHPDFARLYTYPSSFSWFTLAEFWNKPFWSETDDALAISYPFRMSFGLKKVAKGTVDALHFNCEAQKMTAIPPAYHVEKLWGETNTDFPVPLGSWLTLETYYKEGDKDTGRFFCAVTPEGGGPRTVLFDIHNWTHHPDNPAPDGLTHYNPMKVYTSAELVEFLRAQGAAVQVDWDDFTLWSERTPESL